jgi:hypothetical protein
LDYIFNFSRALGHISPSVTPEVKVIDFKSDLKENKNDRAVLFIRIQPSYTPPHYLLKTNEIPVRVHNRNCLADLQTIERLIEKRENLTSGSSQSYPFHTSKEIQLENVSIETVIVTPRYRTDSAIIYYYTKEMSDWLFRNAIEVMPLVEQRLDQWKIEFVGLNSARQVTRYCTIRKYGEITCQRAAHMRNRQFYPLASLEFVSKVMKNAKKIYEKFGFYGDLSVGLTIILTEPHAICLPNIRLNGNHISKHNQMTVSKIVTFDELSNNQKTLEEFFKDLCILFGLALPEKTTIDLVKKIL